MLDDSNGGKNVTEAPRHVVWSDLDEQRSVASYEAHLTRQLGFWLIGACLLLSFVAMTVLGIFVAAGVAVMLVAIPVRMWLWHRRYGDFEREHPEMTAARGMLTLALVLWATALPAMFVGTVLRALFNALVFRRP